MEKKPSVGIVAPRMLNYDLSLQCTCRHFPTLWNKFCSAVALNKFFPASQIFSSEQMFYFKHDVTRDIEVIAGCFLMVRRKAFETVGYLDEQFFMYAEDMDWCKRFWQAGWSVVYFPEAESVHYGGASSANEPLRFSIAQEKALFAYWKKYHGKISVFALICITVLQHALRILSLEFMIKTKTEYKKEKKAQLNKHVSCLRALILE
jgi:GT2 family glycosyltransferase